MKPTIYHYFVVITIFLAGVLLLYAAEVNRQFPLLHEIGVLFVTVVPILFLYEFALRANFKKEMRAAIDDAIRESALENKLSEAIDRSLPASFHYLLMDGMVGAFRKLDSWRVQDWISNSANAEIRVSNWYIPDVINGQNPESYLKAVKNGCKIKILLYDANCVDHLLQRAMSANADVQDYVVGIRGNIRFFQEVWKALKLLGLQSKLEVRLHQNLMSYALWGFGEYYVVGLYHYGKSAVQGVQWRIHRSGPGVSGSTAGFEEIDKTFDLQWEQAQKQVVFEPEQGDDKDEANGCYVNTLL